MRIGPKGQRGRVAVLAGLTVVQAVAAFGLRPDASRRITPENFDRIRWGMAPEQVYAILGPPGDYTTGPTHKTSADDASPFSPSLRTYREKKADLGWVRGVDFWMCDTAEIYTNYGPDGVWVKSFYHAERLPQSRFDNLVWRAKRQWRKWFPG